jgi:hypothetical protein
MEEVDFQKCVELYHGQDPSRFENTNQPFILCDYGCTNGGSSILPLNVF